VERREACLIITLHHPPVNALTRTLAAALDGALEEARSLEKVERVVITGQGKIFIAGADIREIERITKREAKPDLSYLNALLGKIEDFPVPVVMALNGAALGIGLETAMAGHYRVMSQTATVGLPEVNLGLIPGAGGTQRLPRLVGLARALAMIESGTALNAVEALDAGIVDDVVPAEELLVVAMRSRLTRRRTRDLPLPASRAVSAVLAAYAATSFEEGLEAERRLFEKALESSEARAKVYLFFAERDATKLPSQMPMGKVEPVAIEHPGRAVELVFNESTSGERLESVHADFRKRGRIPVCVREPVLARLAEAWDLGDRAVFRAEVERMLAEGIVQRASDVDVLFVHARGYPPEEGGPLFSGG
jgi:3-hydroxyacyl-CoA dehydrogenase